MSGDGGATGGEGASGAAGRGERAGRDRVTRAYHRLLRAAFPRSHATAELDEAVRVFAEVWARETGRSGPLGSALWTLGAFAAAVRDGLAERAEAGTSWLRLGSLPGDVRIAVRSLVRRPLFTSMVVLTVGLGIGANAAIFSVVHAVLLRPLPFPDPDRLVMVWESNPGGALPKAPASAEDFLHWSREARSFEGLAGVSLGQLTLGGEGGEPERVTGAFVRAEFFDVLGVAPELGRPFTGDAHVDGRHRWVVLGHGLWERRFGGDPEVVGRTLTVDGESFQVAAVMPRGFRYPSAAELWVPMVFSPVQLEDRNWHFIVTLGRLGAGVALADAEAEMRALAARQAETFPTSNEGWTTLVEPAHGAMVANVRPMLLVLLGAVGFVLLIACANVANLLLVRASGRMRELSVRAALGAGKGRLARQLLVESLVLAGAGGLLGVLLATAGVEALVGISPVVVPAGGSVAVDLPVLAAALAAAIFTGLLFGAAPLAMLGSAELETHLRSGGRGAAGAPGGRLRSGLVVAETGLALVLTLGAGLLLQSMWRISRVDPGFPVEELAVTPLSLPQAEYDEPAEVAAFWERLLEGVRAVPGVRSAGLSPWVPPQGGPQFHFRVEGVHTEWRMDLPVVRVRPVSEGYLETLGVPLLRGRLLDRDDRSGTPRVAVVDAVLADRFWPGEDPLGQRLRTLEDEPREVVGVVGPVRNVGLAADPEPTVYLPLTQTSWADQTLVLRTAGDPAALARAVRQVVRDLDPDLPFQSLESMDRRLSDSVAQPRFQMVLLGLFAGLALILAAVGIYGVMAFAVAERTREIGLRMALGATDGRIARSILGRALLLVAAGVGLGSLASLGLARVMAGFLFQVEATDPATFLGVATVLVLVAVAASAIPAWRAARMDPLTSLHHD